MTFLQIGAASRLPPSSAPSIRLEPASHPQTMGENNSHSARGRGGEGGEGGEGEDHFGYYTDERLREGRAELVRDHDVEKRDEDYYGSPHTSSSSERPAATSPLLPPSRRTNDQHLPLHSSPSHSPSRGKPVKYRRLYVIALLPAFILGIIVSNALRFGSADSQSIRPSKHPDLADWLSPIPEEDVSHMPFP